MTEEEELAARIEVLEAGSDNQRLINNLSYATALTARHWLTARRRVLSLVPESQAATSSTSLASLVLSVLGGVATIASGGLALLPCLGIAAIGAVSVTTLKGVVSGASMGISAAKGKITKLKAADSMVDPLEFFLDCELSLRRLAAEINDDAGVMTQTVQIGSLNVRLKDLKNEEQWKFLFARPRDKNPGEYWRVASEVIEAQMRRLAWRCYCRSLWGTDNFLASIRTEHRELQPPNHWMDPDGRGREWYPSSWKKDPPATWPYQVWNLSFKSKGGLLHTIFSDFQGPEYFPEHKCNLPQFAGKDLRDRAKLMTDRMSWISLAVIQCCKIKSEKGTIDLEGNVTLAGSNGNAVLPPGDVPPAMSIDRMRQQVLKETPKDQALWAKLHELYGSDGVPNVRIVAARVSNRVNVFGNTGKKGTIRSGYDGNLDEATSIGDISMPSVPQGGTIEFVLAGSGISSFQSVALKIQRCHDRKDTIELDQEKEKVEPQLKVDNGISVASGYFFTTSPITITCTTKTLKPGIYAVSLEPSDVAGRLDSKMLVYFDRSVWFFRVAPVPNRSDELYDLRWTLAWIYGRMIELLKQDKHDPPHEAADQMIAKAHAHVEDVLPSGRGEFDRNDFFNLNVEQLRLALLTILKLTEYLKKSNFSNALGAAEDQAIDESFEIKRFMEAVGSQKSEDCLLRILSALNKSDKPAEKDLIELKTIFRVISEKQYEDGTKGVPKSRDLPADIGPVYYDRVR